MSLETNYLAAGKTTITNQVINKISVISKTGTNIPSVPVGHWKDRRNRRKFFEELKIKFDIKEPKDWAKLSTQDIHENKVVVW